jgi:hypothetical protein
VQEEGAAADARALRFHQCQHHLHRNRRVDGGTADGQDLPTGLGGERIGCRRHVARGGPARQSRAKARCGFRL